MVSKQHNDADSTASLKNKLQSNEELEAEHTAKLLEHPEYTKLQEQLDEAEKKANQNFDRMLRMQAEMENTNRRVERDIANAHKYALEKFALELLPIIDNLERAVMISTEKHSVLEGVDLTLKMFYTALEKFGIEQVDPLMQPFNPELHQAVSMETNMDVQPNTVLNVLQKGYLLNNRLIRPALVVVSKAS